MRWFRSYVDLPLEPGTLVTLPEANRQHLGRVLRLRDGDAVTLFNGDGYDYPACLTGAGPALGARILSRQPAAAAEARLHLTLVQALARGEKMDWILQKATELGVAAVLPVSTQRCEVRLDGDRAGKRLAHWRQVVASACEQCGRARLPLVAGPQPLSALADAPVPAAEPLRLALDPDGDLTLSDLPLRTVPAVMLAIGPEGGFDPVETAHLQRAGWRRLRLRGRILRTETAGMAAISALLALDGDL